MRHVVLLSYGIGSWAAGKLVARRHGTDRLTLLNTDTRYEDEDTYAWGEAAATNIGGEHVRIADGRDPWQVFFDERMLGSNRRDPCSKILKRRLIDRWFEQNFTPETCVRYIGIHWSEEERFVRVRERLRPWRVQAPLCEPPFIGYSELHAWAEREGLWKQRLYRLGFAHANCGGRCVKQGQAGWKLLLETMPERYAECEQKEEEFRRFIAKDVAILRDRRGGRTRPLTLREFRERLQRGEQCDLFDVGGCNCFGGVENDGEAT